MVVMTARHGAVEVPTRVVDLPSFRRWVHSGVLPEKLPVHFLAGQVWVDLRDEPLAHNQLRSAVYATLDSITRAEALGVLFAAGALFTNDAAGLATLPRAMFVSAASLHSAGVRFTAGPDRVGPATEMVGSPDLVVEIVSPGLEDEKYNFLMSAYHAAGVRECWLFDDRPGRAVELTVHRRTAKRFAAVRRAQGWSKSDVFGRSFRLVEREQFGLQDFVLEAK